MHVSRDYTMCLLFGFEFNPENVIKAREKLASYGDLEVCFETSEKKTPILVPINRIHYDPFTYKRYLQAAPRISEVENSIQLCSDSQIAQFVNAIFGVDMEAYTDYEKQRICAEDVFGIVKLYTNKFESESDFTQWCKRKVNYTQVPFSRKRNESGNTPRMRELYVLKSELLTFSFCYRKRCEEHCYKIALFSKTHGKPEKRLCISWICAKVS
ncbi:hypothetical protein INT48_007729 [Thamnidium elegans]|uniref:Uncharacterized protein n=2 Tax=Thamnidium elegans TaxID=101142 RepID=A0A8H7SHV2_9FUNG|nr:hypothetical protein INT48_007729 [Thamnidium elegans]